MMVGLFSLSPSCFLLAALPRLPFVLKQLMVQFTRAGVKFPYPINI